MRPDATTRPTLAEQRARTVERHVVRALLTARVGLYAAEGVGWEGITAPVVRHTEDAIACALTHTWHEARCPRGCGEVYGRHTRACPTAPLFARAVEGANPVNARPAPWVAQRGVGAHPRRAEGAYLVCAPDPSQRFAPMPRTALVVAFDTLDVLPLDTLVWPVALPPDPRPDGPLAFFHNRTRDAVVAALTLQPLRTLPWEAP